MPDKSITKRSHQPQANSMTVETRTSVKPRRPLAGYFYHQAQALLQCGQKIKLKPVANALTLLVIAIAFALPLLLWSMLSQFQQLTQHWDITPKINLFLKINLQEPQAQELAQRLAAQPEISSVKYISPDQGLQSLQQKTGLRDIAVTLGANPLPAVLEVTPAPALQNADTVQQLADSFKQLPEIDIVQVDLAWIKRLISIMHLVRNLTYGLALILIVSALLIVINTLRLLLQNAQREMQILALLGASRHYIVRPFLYVGCSFGLLSGLGAWAIVAGILKLLQTPVQQLAQLYDSQFQLVNLNSALLLGLIVGTSFLGWVAAWIAIHLQFKKAVTS